MTLQIHHCERCGYDWASRLPNPPAHCARCNSKHWQEEPRPRTQVPYQWLKGPRRVYPVNSLEVGQQIVLKWHTDEHGPILEKNRSMCRSVEQWAKRNGQQFELEPRPAGLVVKRIA